MDLANSAFIILNSVDSTNNYAMANVHAGLAKHGDAYFAMNQTNGKGQRGKSWHTGNGQNIALSIVIEPESIAISDQFKLSAAAALGSFDFFSKYAGEETAIKWPNDIYWRDRKAGGILIENVIGLNKKVKVNQKQTDASVGNYWKYAVIGIGLNINETFFGEDLKNVVSLRQITGAEFKVVELARDLHQHVLKRIGQIEKEDFVNILQEYNAHLFKKDVSVKLKKETVIFETVIRGVTEKGQLFTTDIIDNYFDFGEVEWILM